MTEDYIMQYFGEKNKNMKYMVLGSLDDLKCVVWALKNEPLDSGKTLIVISNI